MTRRRDLHVTYGYDAANELTSVLFTGTSATLSYDYTYSARGQIIKFTFVMIRHLECQKGCLSCGKRSVFCC
jgi:hypothetical protein